MMCPTCGGSVVVVGKRAWCVQTYAKGGCGGFWLVQTPAQLTRPTGS